MHQSFCIDLLLWGSTVGHPSDSWASCLPTIAIPIDSREENKQKTMLSQGNRAMPQLLFLV